MKGADWDMDVFDEGILDMVLNSARAKLPEQMKSFDSLPMFKFGPCPKELENRFFHRAHYMKFPMGIYYGQVNKSDMTKMEG